MDNNVKPKELSVVDSRLKVESSSDRNQVTEVFGQALTSGTSQDKCFHGFAPKIQMKLNMFNLGKCLGYGDYAHTYKVCAQKVLVKIKNHRTSSLLCMSSRIMELSFASTF